MIRFYALRNIIRSINHSPIPLCDKHRKELDLGNEWVVDEFSETDEECHECYDERVFAND